MLASAASDLRQAEKRLERAAEAMADGELAVAAQELRAAERELLDANEALRGSLALDFAGRFPIAGQNLEAIDRSVEMATTVVHSGLRILAVSDELQGEDGRLEVSLRNGTLSLAALDAARTEAESLARQVDPLLRQGEPSYLLGPVRTLFDTVSEEAATRADQARVLARGLALLHELSGGNGPRRYLIAVANTAEMRGSGGMILNYGTLEGRDGTIELPEFGRIDELPLTVPVSESIVPADYLARWAGFEPLLRFRQANLAADFTIVAPVLEEMYEQASGREVQGVIQIDPDGLAAVLAGVGPVEVPEIGVVTAEDVVALTLHEAYIRFPDVEQRSDVLGDVAEAAFTKLVDGDHPSLRTLGEALATAVDEGHVRVHSTDATVQRHLSSFGADGALPDPEGPDAFTLTAQNLSGNKLDWFLDTSLTLRGTRPADDIGELEATVQLTNTAPPGVTEPQYIYGPGPGPVVQPAGTLRSLVTLYVPFGTTLEATGGDALVEPAGSGTEGGRPFVTFTVDVPAGEARSVVLTLRLPPQGDDPYEVLVTPVPRVRPTTVDIDIEADDGTVSGTVSLDRRWRLRPGREPQIEMAPIYR